MIETFALPFAQNALIASFLLAIAAGIIGSLVVVNRIVFLSAAIAHTAYGGVGLAFFCGFSPLFGAGIASVLAALIMAVVTLNNRSQSDMAIGVIWAIGMAIGVIFIDFAPGYGGDLMGYLFGSLTAIETGDLLAFGVIDAIILVWAILFYSKLLAIAFDDKFARSKGVKVAPLYVSLLVLSSLAIVIAIRLVGLMLVIALLTIPVWISQSYVGSLWKTMALSAIFSLAFMICGFAIAVAFDVTSGAAIALIAAAGFIVSAIVKRLARRVAR
ncbi:MAG: metal ABC transporter permease [Helicobacteraceae bacterium]|jgi:zinc transport system permease protein|nr:metal ABC transporter permease [Helicobacteraceae bacterium]